jgi:hypothetical protein
MMPEKSSLKEENVNPLNNFSMFYLERTAPNLSNFTMKKDDS